MRYFEIVHGEAAGPADARETFERRPPEGWTYTRKWVIGFRDAAGELRALADVISDLLAQDVWHVGLFIVAAELHGTGAALECYEALERWMRSQGARFLRLGVLAGNERAARFWCARGFVETRQREGVPMGRLTHTLIVMAKPLDEATLAEYLERVPRDRPEAP